MENKSNGWGGFLGNYFKGYRNNKDEKHTFDTHYRDFEKVIYGEDEIDATEPVVPEADNQTSIDFDATNEKFFDEHVIEEDNGLTVDQDFLAGVDDPFLSRVKATVDKNQATPKPEELDFTPEELEAFKQLNKIGEIHETNDPKEMPTETKVKVKVSKPKVEKPVKPAKPAAKAPKKPKAPKAK